MIHRILVPLDGSSLAECTLPHAAAIAKAFDAEIVLLRVVGGRPPGVAAPARGVDSFEWRLQRAESESYLDRISGVLRDQGIKTERVLAVGRSSEEILKVARDRRAELIVLSSHGQGGLTDFHLSGTATKVISLCSCSILLISPNAQQTPPYHRLLVPVDCSPRSDWSVCLAASIARRAAAELLLVHVVPTPDTVTEAGEGTKALELARLLTDLNRANAKVHLEELVSNLKASDLSVRYRIVDQGQVAAVLQRVADEEKASLIVLSAHGRAPETGWPFGTIASTLIAHETIPTLVFQDVRPESRVQDSAVGLRPLASAQS